MDRDPLRACEARALLRDILESGCVLSSKHFKREAQKDGLLLVDAENVLRGGVVREPECENGSWRYSVETRNIRVVIAFPSEEEVLLVTIMRLLR